MTFMTRMVRYKVYSTQLK